MIVLIDLDDVMADTSEYFYEILREKHPNIKEFQTPRTHFDIKDAYSPGNLKKVQSMLYSKKFQLSIPPVPGALEAVNEINNRGHEVVFCSAPHEYYETCVLEKYKWLEKYFGRPFTKKLILTNDKTLIHGDLLIDDNPEIKGRIDSPSWEQILFTRSYNKNINSKQRLENWSDWKKVLTEL